MRSGVSRRIARVVVGAVVGGAVVSGWAVATGAEADAVRLLIHPDRVTTNVAFLPGDDAVRLELRAMRVPEDPDAEPVSIKARGGAHRDAQGLYRVELVVKKDKEPKVAVVLPVVADELDLPPGRWDVGLVLKGWKGDRVEFLAATPLAHVEVGPSPQRTARFVADLAFPEPPPPIAPAPSVMPPLPSKVLPTPQAPAKAMPGPLPPGVGQAVPPPVLPGRPEGEMGSRPEVPLPQSAAQGLKRLVRLATNRQAGATNATEAASAPPPPLIAPPVSEPAPMPQPGSRPVPPVLPSPQAPSKVMPSPQAPSKVAPAPQAPMSDELIGRFKLEEEMLSKPYTPLSEHETSAVKRYVFLATNRKLRPGTDHWPLGDRFENNPDVSGKLTYGLCEVNVPVWIDGKFRPQGEMPLRIYKNDPRSAFRVIGFDPIDWQKVHDLLVKLGTGAEGDILVFVHGYNNSIDYAALRLAQVAQDTRFLGRSLLFSWPSNGTAVFSGEFGPDWSAYNRDEEMAAVSGAPLELVLRQLFQVQVDKAAGKVPSKVHVIAHSMGNRVLLDALNGIARTASTDGPKPLGHVIFAEPDVDLPKFQEQVAATWKVADDVTLYFNPHDRALQVSARLLHFVPRAGADGVIQFDLKRLENVDSSNASTTVLGHDYIAASNRLLDDLRPLLFNNFHASERTMTLKQDYYKGIPLLPYWKFPPPM
jgi:Alpha/beta hydrolase of unknown function (DUF900)